MLLSSAFAVEVSRPGHLQRPLDQLRRPAPLRHEMVLYCVCAAVRASRFGPGYLVPPSSR